MKLLRTQECQNRISQDLLGGAVFLRDAHGDKAFHGQIIWGLRKPAYQYIKDSENSLETNLNVSLSKGGTLFFN